jgi:hypothetical protein
MRAGVLCLELGMPPIHISVIEASNTQHRKPCVLATRASPTTKRRLCQQRGSLSIGWPLTGAKPTTERLSDGTGE